jgi:hypothetical protein
MYHRICWENTYIDIPDSILDAEDLHLIESGSIGASSTLSITTSTIPTSITLGVSNIAHANLNQRTF